MNRLFITALACLLSFSVLSQNEYSLFLDGESSGVNLPTSDLWLDHESKFTLSYTVKLTEDQFPSYPRFTSGYFWHFFETALGGGGSNTINFHYGANWYDTSHQMLPNQWYQLVWIYDNTELKLYVNANLVYNGTHDLSGLSTSDQYSAFGNHLLGEKIESPPGQRIKGNFSNVQLWNKALSLNEIQTYYQCKPQGDEQNLIGYWKFNEGFGEVVKNF